jgi:thiamine biosynthesis lipoprotein
MRQSLRPEAVHRVGGDAAWRKERRELYHGIPVTVAARGCPDGAWDAVWRLLVDADGVFNRFSPTSAISRLAALPDCQGEQPPPALAAGIRAALRALVLSRGASDASIRPLVALWRLAVERQEWPAPDRIAAARARCRLRDVHLAADGRLVRRGGPWMADLDLGGVIKGVLVDQVAERLRAAGVADLLVQVGGETTTLGRAAAGRPWRIGLQHPLVEDATWLVLQAPDGGLSCSTSADYRRGWSIAGAPVSHLIDPRDGRPASPDLLTAQVAFPACGRCGDAEALGKAVALLEREEADQAVAAAGGEWLHLAACAEGVVETRSLGFERLMGAA